MKKRFTDDFYVLYADGVSASSLTVFQLLNYHADMK